MKTMNLLRSMMLIAMAAMLAVGFNSCKKDDDDHDHDHEGKGHVHLYFKNVMGSMDFMTNHEHTLANGRKYKIEDLLYYVHNIRLKAEDGTEYPVGDDHYLVRGTDVLEIDVEDLPAGHYHGVMFDVGVDTTENLTVDPTTRDAGDPLAPQTPSMYWSWNSGHIFLRIDGSVDTTAAKTGAADYGFRVHLGTNNFLTPVSLEKHFDADEDAHPSVTVNFDVEALLNGGDLNVGYGSELASDAAAQSDSVFAYTTTMTMNNMPLAMKVKASLPDAFSAN